MKRLSATISCDMRLQLRNGFYYAVGFVVVGWAVLLNRLPAFQWSNLMPVLVLGNLVMSTFYFVGGLVLLEKAEGTLEAQVVTPLRRGEYLLSKIGTLTALALAENLLIALMACGAGFGGLLLAGGIIIASILYVLIGFAFVVRYDSINEYLMPSVAVTLVLSLPYLHYFGIWNHPLMYLHPLQAPLVLMKAAFVPVQAWELLYGLLYGLLWIAPLFMWCKRAFTRFVLISEGVR